MTDLPSSSESNLLIDTRLIFENSDVGLYDQICEKVTGYVSSLGDVILSTGASLRDELKISKQDLWSLLEAELDFHCRTSSYTYFLIEHLIDCRRPAMVTVSCDDVLLHQCAKIICSQKGIAFRSQNASVFHALRRWLERYALNFLLNPEASVKRVSRAVLNFVQSRAGQNRPGISVPASAGNDPSWRFRENSIVIFFEYRSELTMLLPVIEDLLSATSMNIGLCPLSSRVELAGDPDVQKLITDRERCYLCCDIRSLPIDEVYQSIFGPLRSRFGSESLCDFLKQEPGWAPIFLSDKDAERVLNYRFFSKVLCHQNALDFALQGGIRPGLAIFTCVYGAVSNATLKRFSRAGVPRLAIPHFSDQLRHDVALNSSYFTAVAVMGSRAKERICRNREELNLVCVCGSPSFDAAFAARTGKPPALAVKPRTILFAAQGLRGEPALLRTLIAAVRTGGWGLVIRPHPLHTPLFYDLLVWLSRARNVIVSRQDSLHDSILQSDLLVTVSSMAAYDAIILDTPVMLLSSAYKADLSRLDEYGAAIRVNELHSGDLELALNDIEIHKRLSAGRAKLLEDYFQHDDLGAAVCLSSFIESLTADTQ